MAFKHGKDRTPVYRSWEGMKSRCYRQTDRSYSRYGGRGITVCERWFSFEAFYADMGDPPTGGTLDRIDGNGNYEPGNCRWASRAEQTRNRSTNHLVNFRGETKCLMDWALHLGIKFQTLRHRLIRGWSVEEAFTKAVPHVAAVE